MATELASAYLTLIPSLKNAQQQIESQLAGVDGTRAGKSIGKGVSTGFGGAISGLAKSAGSAFVGLAKVGVAAVGTITTAVGGLALKGGFERALAIESAEAKLKGLGHSSESVSAIMDDALASVKGTAFGLGDAATVAAQMSAAGVASGERMQQVLKTVADTAQISGRSLSETGTIFAKVASKGKLQGEEMMQLMEAGIPVTQMLAKHLGKTSEEISSMVSKGEIDFETFSAAMQEGMGGAALKAGDTFAGAMANVKAALGRLGEKVATPALESLRKVFNALIPVIDGVVTALQPLLDAFAEKLGKATDWAVGKIGAMGDSIASFGDSMKTGIGSGNAALSGIAPVVGVVAGAFGGLLGSLPIVGNLFEGLGAKGLGVIGVFVGMVQNSKSLRDALDAFGKTVGGLVSMLVPLAEYLLMIAGDVMGSLGDAIAPIVTLAGDLIAAILPQLVMMVLQIAPAIKQVADAVAPLIGQLVSQLAPVIKDFVDAVLPVLLDVIESLMPVITQIVGVVAEIAAILIPFIAEVVGTVLPVIAEIIEAVAPLISQLAELLVPALELVRDAVETVLPVILERFQTVMGAIQGVIEAVWPTIETIISTVMTVVQDVIAIATAAINGDWDGVWNGMQQLFSDVWSGIQSIGESAVNSLKEIVHGVVGPLAEWWNAAWKGVGEFFANVGSGIASVAKGKFDEMRSSITDKTAKAKEAATRSFDTMKRAIGDACGALRGVVVNGFQSAINYITGLPGQAWNWGADIVSGIVSGIRDSIDNVARAASEVASNIRSFLHFSVPDEGPLADFDTYMPDMMRGLADGIVSNIGVVRTALGNVSKVMAGELEMDIAPSVSVGGLQASLEADYSIRPSGGVEDRLDALADMFDRFVGMCSHESKVVLDDREVGRFVRKVAHA